mmetsp:Transcript_93152/g.278087  ORF Transcript_93152/g.278087 Transcript_93152/m.278087 type:complete len:201 (+) Transcript_93152:2-604(+)
MVVPGAALNVVIANLFVQMCMLTNRFYTKLPSWLQWITVMSITRFTPRILLKIEYSWRDMFEVSPMHGSYIPAELTGTFQVTRERQMNVMESPNDAPPAGEMLAMAAISLGFLLLFALELTYQVWRLVVGYSQQEGLFDKCLPYVSVAEPDPGEEARAQAAMSQDSEVSYRGRTRAQSRANAGSLGALSDQSHEMFFPYE